LLFVFSFRPALAHIESATYVSIDLGRFSDDLPSFVVSYLDPACDSSTPQTRQPDSQSCVVRLVTAPSA
jgi:hypothetical protein